MNYLNLETKNLHAPEYIGSDPRARATWLSVSLWCAAIENGGRIIGAKSWKDRQWQQTCGVTVREVNSSAPLLVWNGDDLIVWAYPLRSEAELQAKREAGRAGGLKSAEARAKQTPSIPSSTASSETPSCAATERKGKEKEGKGSNTLSAPPAPRPRDLVFDAIVEVTGQNPAMSGGEIGKAIKAIKSVSPDVTPDEIRRRAVNYKTQFRDTTMSASALAKWWTKCESAGLRTGSTGVLEPRFQGGF